MEVDSFGRMWIIDTGNTPNVTAVPAGMQRTCPPRIVIVNISTAWAMEPVANFPTSAVFRSGLAAFTKLVSDKYAQENIRINNVLPGWIDSLPATEERRAGVPMGRYGTSQEIAATVAFLLSDGAGYITGQNLRVDGGVTKGV